MSLITVSARAARRSPAGSRRKPETHAPALKSPQIRNFSGFFARLSEDLRHGPTCENKKRTPICPHASTSAEAPKIRDPSAPLRSDHMPQPSRLAINTLEVIRDSIPRNEPPEPDAGSNGRVPRLRDAGGGQGRAQRVRSQRMSPASMLQSGHSRGAGTPRLGWMNLDLAGFAGIYRIAVVPLVSNPAFHASFAFTAARHGGTSRNREPQTRTTPMKLNAPRGMHCAKAHTSKRGAVTA